MKKIVLALLLFLPAALWALSSLGGTLDEKLDAVRSAVESRTTGLETKLALIEAALGDISTAGNRLEQEMGLIQQAISALDGTLDEKLASIEAAVKSQTTGLETKFGAILTALNSGFADDASALGLVQTALGALKQQLGDVEGGLSKAIDDVSSAFGTLSGKVNTDLATALSNVLTAIQGLPDYSAVMAAIQQVLAGI